MAKKKTFITEDNPALRFITNPDEKTEKTPAPYKPNPAYIETKSKRVQLLMQPSLYSKVKAKADRAGISFNEYIHKALENLTKGE